MKNSDQNRNTLSILSLSLDSKLENPDSEVRERTREYGDLVRKYTVIFPSTISIEAELSPEVSLYGVAGGSKLSKLGKMYSLAASLLQKERYSVITVQDAYYLAFAAWLLARQRKIGLEIQVHGFEKTSFLRMMLARFLLKRGDSIRVVSSRLKRELEENYKVDPKKITVVAILAKSFKPSKTNVKKEEGTFVFLTVARLVPVKNISLQIRAMVDARPNTRLWIVGDGEEREKLEKLTRDLGLEEKVTFFGWVGDVGAFYEKADTLLITSDYEGYGLTAVEALQHGIPVLMTDVGLAGEVVGFNFGNGMEIPVGDPLNTLVCAMKNMMEDLGDPRLKAKIQENIRKSLLKLPTKEETRARYLESWARASGARESIRE